MTEPRGTRSLDDILAEAEADEQETPVIEPFTIRLKNDHVVTFRDPADIETGEADSADPGLRGQMLLLTTSRRDFRQLWAELRHVPQRRISALIQTVIDYYEEARQGKGRSSS